MKKLLTTSLLMIAFAACKEEDNGPQMGCMTGIPKGYTNRGLIRCCTREQYLAGSNVAAGGTPSFKDFTSIKWEATSDCAKCK